VPVGALSRCTGLPRAEFEARHWSRTPLLRRAADLPGGFADLLSADDVDELVADRALREPFFRVVKDAAGVPGTTRAVTAGSRRVADVADADAVTREHLAGATLVLNSLHRNHPPVVRFCRALAEELGHQVQANAYVTPAGDAQGFAFHHDTHDVFVLQVSGHKHWQVHAPLVELPLPSQPRAGAGLVGADAVPLLDVVLEPGDSLYLPRGYVHAAATTDEHSVHLTIGVLSTTWYDVLQDVAALAAEDVAFRDALPVGPEAALDELPAFLRRVADWVEQLPAEQVRERVARRLARAVSAEPLRMLAQAEAVRRLGPGSVVRPRRGLGHRLDLGDPVRLRLPGREITLPAVTGPALGVLLDGGPVTPAAIGAGDLGLDDDDALVLVRRMLREGVLVPADERPGHSLP
jgi:lysine-specific demethylase/histidyl-hydroxylase NO66